MTDASRRGHHAHYFPILDWVFRLPIPAPEWRTYCALAMHVNGDGRAWPSHATLADLAGCSTSALKRHLWRLEREFGVLSISARHRADGGSASNAYTLREVPDMTNVLHRWAVDNRGGGGARVNRGGSPSTARGRGPRVAPQELPKRELPRDRTTLRARAKKPTDLWTTEEMLSNRLTDWQR